MNIKKFLLPGMAFLLGLSLVACGKGDTSDATISDNNTALNSTPASLTITSLNADKEEVELEIPYNPERVAVLDMAVLDILDNYNLGDHIVGMAKGTSIDYLSEYYDNDNIANVGTLKEVDMESLMSCEPDVIFIGGRLAGQYDELSKIAPVVYLTTDYEIGLIESVKNNASTIAKIFGVTDKANELLSDFDSRVEALAKAANGQSAVIGIITSSNFNTLGNDGRCSIIGKDIGFNNLASDIESTHGNESSFELLVELNPEYIFVLDRDSAIGDKGAKLAKEVMENELVKKTNAYKNGNIVYLTPTVWYLAEGGLTATDIMLQDLEGALIK